MKSSMFDKLPAELVLKIASYLHYPKRISGSDIDLQSLSQCSKRIWHTTLPLLYHTICVPNASTVDKFLQQMIDFPSRAHLVKNLRLDWPKLRTIPQDWPNEKRQASILQLAKTKKLPSNLISHLEKRHHWAYGLLLVVLLPNLNDATFIVDGVQVAQGSALLATLMQERQLCSKPKF
ncbi:hypothetical protein CPB86DRAFT_818450 [Serendipita vermifera]|nr:hypothetical protein CPB86DRAFT_818450 [Serendipita vermifera]